MTPFYADEHLAIHVGNCRAVLRELPAESVDAVVTSPPYWGLRDYGTATWTGGDAACDHRTLVAGRATRPAGGLTGGKATVDAGTVLRGGCGRCGAQRVDSQLGLEPTPELYVEHLVAVFREVRRVLRRDGTVWLNLGDSYAGGGQTGRKDGGRPEKGRGWAEYDIQRTKIERRDGLKPKDLVGIPWRVAFALQADGWYLRSDIIWSKPNPMPESVTDRPTKSHEYVFLLSKAERYHYDADAIRERAVSDHRSGNGYARPERETFRNLDGSPRGQSRGWDDIGGRRNRRSVWTIATQPYPDAHFATFPEALVEPCVLAGCPPDGLVLDPFGGSGTVGLVANRLGRRAVLVDLNPEYAAQALRRIAAARSRGDGPAVDMPVPAAADGLWAEAPA